MKDDDILCELHADIFSAVADDCERRKFWRLIILVGKVRKDNIRDY
jgi:hypothetical protein